MDYPDNNRLIAHYCGFNIMESLPSYWTYDRFLRQLDNAELKTVMADLVRRLYELGVVDASFIGLDSTAAADILAAADQTISTDYSLSIDRSCLYFKRIHALRTECQRCSSGFKASGQERLWVHNGISTANLNTLAHNFRFSCGSGRCFVWFSLLPLSQADSAYRMAETLMPLYQLGSLPRLAFALFFAGSPQSLSEYPALLFLLDHVLLIFISITGIVRTCKRAPDVLP